MNDFLQMDIFFFVTTLVATLLGVLAGLLLYRVWKILGHVEEISREVSQEAVLVRADIDTVRTVARTEGLRKAAGAIQSAFKRFGGKRRKDKPNE
jgi:hypothetical protein